MNADSLRAEQAIRLLITAHGMTSNMVIRNVAPDIDPADREAFILRVRQIERESRS